MGAEEQGQPKRKVYLSDDEEKALLVRKCCFHFKLYSAGKGDVLQGDAKNV